MKLLNLLLIICLSALSAIAQELPRRSFLGVQMENISDDTRRIMNLPSKEGVLVKGIIPGSTAAAAGFQTGDVLLSINETKLNSISEAVAYVGSKKGNETFSYVIFRNGKKLSGRSTFSPYPEEKYSDLKVEYPAVKTSLGLQRLIVTTRKDGKSTSGHVYFIGGIGCYSLDTPQDTMRSEVQLLNMLARAGYTTVRLEKSGMGDAVGKSKSCEEISFTEEAESYAEAIASFRESSGHTGKVFVIGHSMGGLMAPLAAGSTRIDGIISYGTIGSNFIEYLAKTRRTIAKAYGWPPDETDKYIKDFCECAAWYLTNMLTVNEASKKNPDCGEYLSVFELRSQKYNEQLYAFNIPALWKSYTGDALFVWGGSDYISSREDHQILTEALNFYQPGKAAFVEVTGSDHGMYTASDFEAARTDPGSYNKQVGDVFLSWLKKRS